MTWKHEKVGAVKRSGPTPFCWGVGGRGYSEGRALGGYGYRVAKGLAACECGAKSPELGSDYARKKCHRRHKDDIHAPVLRHPNATA